MDLKAYEESAAIEHGETTKYIIIDKQKKRTVSEPYLTRAKASFRASKLENKYGINRFRVQSITVAKRSIEMDLDIVFNELITE